MTQKRSWFLAATAILAVGCDAAASDDYQGKPLATINGVAVLSQPASTPPPLEALLMWFVGEAGPDVKVTAERAPVTGTFPAEFTLDVFRPPAATALNHLGDLSFSTGLVMAVRKGAIPLNAMLRAQDLTIGSPDAAVLGIDQSELLLYTDRDLAADDPRSILLGGITRAGYSLMQLVPLSPAEAASRADACHQVSPSSLCQMASKALVPVPGNLSHRITLTIGIAVP